MKKIKLALSIVALLGTLTIVGTSNSRADIIQMGIGETPECDCEFENPHGWGVKDGGCQEIRCWHDSEN